MRLDSMRKIIRGMSSLASEGFWHLLYLFWHNGGSLLWIGQAGYNRKMAKKSGKNQRLVTNSVDITKTEGETAV